MPGRALHGWSFPFAGFLSLIIQRVWAAKKDIPCEDIPSSSVGSEDHVQHHGNQQDGSNSWIDHEDHSSEEDRLQGLLAVHTTPFVLFSLYDV